MGDSPAAVQRMKESPPPAMEEMMGSPEMQRMMANPSPSMDDMMGSSEMREMMSSGAGRAP